MEAGLISQGMMRQRGISDLSVSLQAFYISLVMFRLGSYRFEQGHGAWPTPRTAGPTRRTNNTGWMLLIHLSL